VQLVVALPPTGVGFFVYKSSLRTRHWDNHLLWKSKGGI